MRGNRLRAGDRRPRYVLLVCRVRSGSRCRRVDPGGGRRPLGVGFAADEAFGPSCECSLEGVIADAAPLGNAIVVDVGRAERAPGARRNTSLVARARPPGSPPSTSRCCLGSRSRSTSLPTPALGKAHHGRAPREGARRQRRPSALPHRVPWPCLAEQWLRCFQIPFDVEDAPNSHSLGSFADFCL